MDGAVDGAAYSAVDGAAMVQRWCSHGAVMVQWFTFSYSVVNDIVQSCIAMITKQVSVHVLHGTILRTHVARECHACMHMSCMYLS